MIQGLTVVGVSVSLLFLLTLLFRIESTRERRVVFPGLRIHFDTFVVWMATKMSGLSHHVGSGAVRVTLHYAVHKILAVVIAGLTGFEKRLSALQTRNKKIAKVARNREDMTHLDMIATHKEETALSEEEKRKRRQH